MEGITRIDISASGDSSFVRGTVMGSEIVTRQQQYYNTLTLIDIPLLVGKHFTFRKFDLYLEAGPVVNLSARLTLAEGLFSERADNEGKDRSSLGLSWRGQFSAGYRLTDHLFLAAGIDYRRLPRRGVEVQNAPLKTRYNLLGGKAGIKVLVVGVKQRESSAKPGEESRGRPEASIG